MRDALRPVVALCVVSLVAAATPGAAAADTPSISSSVDGILGTNGWWKGSTHGNNVVLHWTVTANPPLTNTTGCDPAISIPGPTTGVTKTCTATNDDGTSSSSRTIKIDADPPTGLGVTPARAADANGWYNHSVDLNWSGSDATSGIANCSSLSYSGPDSGTALAQGSCQDNAGNSAAKSFGFKYDGTDPQVNAATAGRGPDANGWYSHPVTITWTGSDPTSGIDSCTSAAYSSPDSSAATASGSCTDKAGNVASGPSFNLKYDATAPQSLQVAPSRGTDLNGWYNHLVTFDWSGSDATSGVASCTNDKPYSGSDSASASVSGSCVDNAGNSASSSFSFKYDATDPTIAASPSRAPNANGWYTSSFSVNWNGADAVSGLAGCSAPAQYSGPDDATGSVTGTCSDNAGNSASSSSAFKYDATAPQVGIGIPGRNPDGNGWYSHPVTITWTGTDATSGFAGCTLASYSGPDSASASVAGGTCHDGAGNTAAAPAFHLKYDATPPHIAGATLSRPPDFDGWYTHPVTVTWAGTDALSGIASCTSAPFSGNASATAAATGSCRDKAGNVTSASIPLKYDGTAPALSKVGVASRAGSDLVRWTSSSPDDRIVVKRLARGSKDEQVVFEGAGSRFVDTKIQSGLEYRYAIQSTDQAGNVSKTANVTGFPKVLTLQKTPYVPRAAPKPILRWGSMSAASYYHVQLFRGPTRILAAWPNKRQLGLASSWKWAGHRYTLSPGRYRWFVWGGLGKRSFARYRAMGSARFIVPSR